MNLSQDEITVLRSTELWEAGWGEFSRQTLAKGSLKSKKLLNSAGELTVAGRTALAELEKNESFDSSELLELAKKARQNLWALVKEMLDNSPTSMATRQRAEHRIILAIESYLSGDPVPLKKLAGRSDEKWEED